MARKRCAPTPCVAQQPKNALFMMSHAYLLEYAHADIAEVACHHRAPHPVVHIAVPEVQAVNVRDAVRAKHEATAGKQMAACTQHAGQPVKLYAAFKITLASKAQ
jgi:hypothetical protein